MDNHRGSLDLAFHALSDPRRRAIVVRLCEGPCSVTELAWPLDLSLPLALKHLRVLEAGGFVRSDKAGRTRTYRVLQAPLRAVERWVVAQRTPRERAQERLRKHLE